MRTRIQFLVSVLVIIGLLLPIASLAEEPTKFTGKTLNIAWIPKTLNVPVFETGRTGAFKAAEELSQKYGIEVKVDYVAPPTTDAAEQARIIEDEITKGVNAMAISCNDPTACIDPIKKALAAGIPVMTFDSDSPDSGRFTYLGVDNYQGGKAAADILVRVMGKKGKVALLAGTPGALNLEERMRGFKDVVKNYPEIEIVDTVVCYDDINKGVQVIEEAMQAHPDLNGWFLVGLWPLFAKRGSMPLWEAASQKGMKNVCFDTLDVQLPYVKDGLIQGLVGQKYWGWGYDSIYMIADKMINGKEFQSFTNSGMDIVTSANVDAMAEAWKGNDFTQPLPPAFPMKELNIAWIPKTLNVPVFETGRTGAFKAAEELSQKYGMQVKVDYVAPPTTDAAEQARIIEDEITKGVDAMAISCNDPTACIDPIKKALAAGIPVMTFDSDSPDSGRLTYLGVDNYEGGKAAADMLIRVMGTKGKVALLAGTPGAMNLEERMRGFKDVVKDYPEIEIVDTVVCYDDINKGVQVIEEAMQAHPDLNGWFLVGLWPLFAKRGSMPLWEAASQKGMKNVCFDTLEVQLPYVKDGLIQGLVGQKYWGWGYDSIYMIADHMMNARQFDSFTNSGMDLVTAANVDAMAEAWKNNDFTQPLPPAW